MLKKFDEVIEQVLGLYKEQKKMLPEDIAKGTEYVRHLANLCDARKKYMESEDIVVDVYSNNGPNFHPFSIAGSSEKDVDSNK